MGTWIIRDKQGQTIFGAEPTVGALYDVVHERKGSFRVRVTRFDEEWLHGVIVDGTARFTSEDDRGPAEPIIVRHSLCRLEEVAEPMA
jgi:hypothetical protein